MAWICCEGLDRSGKSTVAEFYKKQGYEVIHLSAPDKKYIRPGYTGPSYLDELMELMVSKSGQNIFWDRSLYGETIWSYVYGRDPQLSEDDIEVLREIEDQNDTTRILMFDPDAKANWQRCVDNKEPLTLQQFNLARQLYSAMAHKYNFTVTSLPKFLEANHVAPRQPTKLDSDPATAVPNNVAAAVVESKEMVEEQKMSKEQEKLEKANAINSVLKTKKLFKQTGWPFDELEGQVRQFLNGQLGDLLGTTRPNTDLSPEDIAIVKTFVQRLKEKQK